MTENNEHEIHEALVDHDHILDVEINRRDKLVKIIHTTLLKQREPKQILEAMGFQVEIIKRVIEEHQKTVFDIPIKDDYGDDNVVDNEYKKR